MAKREPEPKLKCEHEVRLTKVGRECVKCFTLLDVEVDRAQET